MKKRNIIAILASCAAVLTIFTACGSKEEDVTNPTVVGTDGQVYEEITEAVTDTEGEAVTDAQGETQVVVVTKPYTTKKAEKEKDKEKDDDKTQAPDENPATPEVPGTTAAPGTPTTPGTTAAPVFPFLTEPAGETTTTFEDVTLPEGEIIEVPLDQSGKPQQSMAEKLFKDAANSKSLFIDGSIVTNDNQIFSMGLRMKIYLKGNKFATEFPIGMASVRFTFDGKSMNVIFPEAKAYFAGGSAEGSEMDMAEELGLWKMVATDELKYVKTERVKIQGKEYICETYTSDEAGGTMRYCFNSKSELKRIEITAPDKTSTILKVEAASTTVNDSVFTPPKGYEQLSEDRFESLAGTLGLM